MEDKRISRDLVDLLKLAGLAVLIIPIPGANVLAAIIGNKRGVFDKTTEMGRFIRGFVYGGSLGFDFAKVWWYYKHWDSVQGVAENLYKFITG